jgi:4-methyl-5(b-hydroxyethyl)-thiazole monophosphate biosynthesis
MPRCCVTLADGFEEIEAVTIIDVLRRADVETVTLGVAGTTVTGAHGISVQADRTLAEGADEKWDLVILPGGMPGASTLRDDPGVQALIKRQHEAGGRLAAICAAPIALGAAGVLDGRTATCYPSFEDGLTGAKLSESPVVVDGTLTTSRGPGTAFEFALSLVAQLKDDDTARALRTGMLVGAGT